MRIDELRSTLQTHGQDIEASSPETRMREIRGRIRTARRRRAAVAVGGTVAVVATALALLPTPMLDREPAPVAPDQGTGYSKDGVTFRDDVLGERLLGAVIGDPGESRVEVEVVVGEEPLRFSPLCYGVPSEYMVEYSLAGSPLGAVSCQQERDRDPGAGGMTFDASPEEMLDDWNLEPGDSATFVLRLVASRDSDGSTVRHADAVLGGGVYEDTRPTRMVAGVELPELLEHDGRVWELVDTQIADRGEPALTMPRERASADTSNGVTVVAVSGLAGWATYEIWADGELVDTTELAVGRDSPHWALVLPEEGPAPSELQVRVVAGATDRTRLAFARYQPAP